MTESSDLTLNRVILTLNNVNIVKIQVVHVDGISWYEYRGTKYFRTKITTAVDSIVGHGVV